ncbi:hypothetical protein HDK77DRAFT_234266 [Phyllosticta capitalensis]
MVAAGELHKAVPRPPVVPVSPCSPKLLEACHPRHLKQSSRPLPLLVHISTCTFPSLLIICISTMSNDILALPHKVPEVEKWRDEPNLLPAALYTLFDISNDDFIRLQEACEMECEIHRRGDCVKPPPKFSFPDLKSIMEYHLQLAEAKQFDPTLFIVAVDKSWEAEGVLLVTLDFDDDQVDCISDKFWVQANKSGSCFVNISIGESDWQKAKQSFAISK